MKLLPLKASLIALALFGAAETGIAFAATSVEPGAMVVAQADDASAAGSQRIDAIKKFLAGGRKLSKFDDAKLQQRLKRAQKFKSTPDLPADLAQGLDQEIAELNDELGRRQSGTASATAEVGTQAGDQQPASNTGDGGQAAAPAASSSEVADFLSSVQPLDTLDKKSLRAQMRKAAQLSKTEGISSEDRQKLRQIVRDSRTALGKGQSGGTADGDAAAPADAGSNSSAPVDTSSKSAGTQAPATGDVAAFIQGAAPVTELKDGELRKQMREAARLSKTDGLSKDDRQKLRGIVQDARAELEKRKGGSGNDTAVKDSTKAGDQASPTKPVDTKAVNGQTQADASKITVDIVSEQKAQDILNDQADAKTMNKGELRKRLASMRELLGANKLSPGTNKALRQKLATERTYLRQAVGKDTQGTGQGGNGATGNVTINQNVIKVVIADRRPSADLKDDELRNRINVYSKIVIDVNYPDNDRQQWRAVMDRDRVVLRQRMLDARGQRAARLKAKGKDINIDLSLEFKPGRPVPPRSVFAAEADDQEITDVLAAPPRRKLDRKYSVEEVESDPQLRDAVARIEIDTVHFGFGEGFLREEEIDNLDRIAEIMEKILAVNPGEVFMIEGHTDAVGSDPANLDLSRERAKAVKQALSTYYVIPADNLKTVGFGERYLKIPTSDPEAENRRVSIARITPLVGALGQ